MNKKDVRYCCAENVIREKNNENWKLPWIYYMKCLGLTLETKLTSSSHIKSNVIATTLL